MVLVRSETASKIYVTKRKTNSMNGETANHNTGQRTLLGFHCSEANYFQKSNFVNFISMFQQESVKLGPHRTQISLTALQGYITVMPNTQRRHRRDETVFSRRLCEQNSQLVHDDFRRIRSTIWKLTKQTP